MFSSFNFKDKFQIEVEEDKFQIEVGKISSKLKLKEENITFFRKYSVCVVAERKLVRKGLGYFKVQACCLSK